MENQFCFVAGPYHCVATRSDRPWGHALDMSVFDAVSGDFLNTLAFACHPEFAGYEELQAMSTEQLVELAKAQLESGALDAPLADHRTRQLPLIVRFEAPAS
jgi:hypothetical protein